MQGRSGALKKDLAALAQRIPALYQVSGPGSIGQGLGDAWARAQDVGAALAAADALKLLQGRRGHLSPLIQCPACACGSALYKNSLLSRH